jgi:hypothetical protein
MARSACAFGVSCSGSLRRRSLSGMTGRRIRPGALQVRGHGGVLVDLATAFVTLASDLLCMSCMKTHHVFSVLVALVLVPFLLTWGTLLLIPAALLLVPCVLLAAIAALPALLVAATSARHETPRPQAPVSTMPIYST